MSMWLTKEVENVSLVPSSLKAMALTTTCRHHRQWLELGFLRTKALDPAGLFCAEAEVLKKLENETSPLEQHKVEDMQFSRTHPSGILLPSPTHLQPGTTLPPASPSPQHRESSAFNHWKMVVSIITGLPISI